MNERSTTIMVSEEGKSAIVCNYNIAMYESRGWKVSEDQSLPHPVVEDPVNIPTNKPDESSDDAEPTPEDKKKIDKLIAEAEAEKVIEPDPEKPDEPGTPEQPKQPKQPKQPEPEDDVIMPAE